MSIAKNGLVSVYRMSDVEAEVRRRMGEGVSIGQIVKDLQKAGVARPATGEPLDEGSVAILVKEAISRSFRKHDERAERS